MRTGVAVFRALFAHGDCLELGTIGQRTYPKPEVFSVGEVVHGSAQHMSAQPHRLYGRFSGRDEILTAEVGRFSSFSGADESMQGQRWCWSDEGLKFFITSGPEYPETNSSYEDLELRVMK